MLEDKNHGGLKWSSTVWQAVLLCGCLPVLGIAQQPGALEFDLWAQGSVFDLAVNDEQQVLVAGVFVQADRSLAGNLVRLDADASFSASFRPLIDGTVNAAAVTPDGELLIGGSFQTINGSSVDGLAKLNASGDLIQPWPVTVEGFVLALAQDGFGQAYAGGVFTQFNGVPRSSLARISLATGALDAGFSPSINGAVLSVFVDSQDNVWVGGIFDAVNGTPSSNLVVLDSAGATVQTFAVDGRVERFSETEDGRVLACGGFRTVDGQSRSRTVLFAQNDGFGLDDWSVEIDDTVFFCDVDGQSVILGGDFTSVNGLTRKGVARVSLDGAVDPHFQPSFGGAFVGVRGGGARILSIARQGFNLVVAGIFNQVNGVPSASVAVIDSKTGSLIQPLEVERPAEVRRAIARLADGSLLVGGRFRRSGEQLVSNVFRALPDGQVDESWPISSDGPVWVSKSMPDGSLLLGGFFGRLGGETRYSLARLTDPVTGELDAEWAPDISGSVLTLTPDQCATERLFLGGSIGSGAGGESNNLLAIDLRGAGTALPLDVAFDLQVNAVLQPDCDSLLVGGSFFLANQLARRGLARINLQNGGSVDASFNAGLNGSVWSLLAGQGLEGTYIGGEFTSIFGQTRRRLAQLTAQVSAWNPNSNGTPVDMVADGLGGIYTVGTFTQIRGTQRLRIARLEASGGGDLDADFNPGSDGPTLWGAALIGNQLFVSGVFSEVGGLVRRSLAEFEVAVSAGDALFSDRFETAGRIVHFDRAEDRSACQPTSTLAYSPLPSDQPILSPACPEPSS